MTLLHRNIFSISIFGLFDIGIYIYIYIYIYTIHLQRSIIDINIILRYVIICAHNLNFNFNATIFSSAISAVAKELHSTNQRLGCTGEAI